MGSVQSLSHFLFLCTDRAPHETAGRGLRDGAASRDPCTTVLLLVRGCAVARRQMLQAADRGGKRRLRSARYGPLPTLRPPVSVIHFYFSPICYLACSVMAISHSWTCTEIGARSRSCSLGLHIYLDVYWIFNLFFWSYFPYMNI
jgi:hypothetical protein